MSGLSTRFNREANASATVGESTLIFEPSTVLGAWSSKLQVSSARGPNIHRSSSTRSRGCSIDYQTTIPNPRNFLKLK